jgi:hypothetical protein
MLTLASSSRGIMIPETVFLSLAIRPTGNSFTSIIVFILVNVIWCFSRVKPTNLTVLKADVLNFFYWVLFYTSPSRFLVLLLRSL